MAITGPTRTTGEEDIRYRKWTYTFLAADIGSTDTLDLPSAVGDLICEVNTSGGSTDTYTVQGSVTGDVWFTVKDLDGSDCSGTGDKGYEIRSMWPKLRVNKASGTTDGATITFAAVELRQ